LNAGEKVFLQGSKATCMFIVFKGRVELSKRVPNNNAQNVRSKLLNSFKDRNSKKQEIQRNSRLPNLTCSSHININIQDIDRGSVFGENAAIDSSVYEYNAVSKGVSEIIVINDKDIQKYFDVSEMDIYRE
jgi:CRP-like cAMP-binding protein